MMYSQQQQQNKYLETTVQTASPAKLLLMLYDGAIRFTKQAIDALEKQNYEDANRYLGKTQSIINEFVITLDLKSPFAEDLLKLYEYFLHLLIQSNLKKDPAPAAEVLEYLKEFRETWVEASKAAAWPAAGVAAGHA